MAYVTVPKDLTKIKSKVMFNLTKRQLLCFGAADPWALHLSCRSGNRDPAGRAFLAISARDSAAGSLRSFA